MVVFQLPFSALAIGDPFWQLADTLTHLDANCIASCNKPYMGYLLLTHPKGLAEVQTIVWPTPGLGGAQLLVMYNYVTCPIIVSAARYPPLLRGTFGGCQAPRVGA